MRLLDVFFTLPQPLSSGEGSSQQLSLSPLERDLGRGKMPTNGKNVQPCVLPLLSSPRKYQVFTFYLHEIHITTCGSFDNAISVAGKRHFYSVGI